MSTNNEFYSKMLNSFIELMDTNGACDTILRVLTANCKRNAQKENGQQQTVMTVKPAFRIEYDAQGNITIRTKLDVQEIETNHFEVEVKFNPGLAMQPDLGLETRTETEGTEDTEDTEGTEAAGTDGLEITREAFYKRVCDADLTEQDLDQYFAQSECGDFETWLATGTNHAKAIEILDDSDAWDSFRTLVMETLDAMADDEEKEQ